MSTIKRQDTQITKMKNEERDITTYVRDIKKMIVRSNMNNYMTANWITQKKFAGYKINMQKSIAFSHTNKKLSERKIKKIILFRIA